MPVASARAVKCTPEECRTIAKKALVLHPVLKKPEALTERARLFQALGNETRLKIIGLFNVRELCACEVTAAIRGAPSTVTHHLRILEDAGLIASRQEGKFTLYSVNAELLAKHRVFATGIQAAGKPCNRSPSDRPPFRSRPHT